MIAVQYDASGGPERLHLREVDPPAMRSAKVLVRVRCAALNPKDALFRKGRFRLISGRRFPKWCGVDFAGEVAHSHSPDFREGDRVFGALDEWRFERGTLAGLVAPDAAEVARLPDAVSFEHGAAVPLVGLTALQALRDLAQLQRGAEVLVHGASGGLGTIAIQVATLLGARVTSSSSAANGPLCASLGAAVTLDYRADELLPAAPRYDCVFDVFGNLSFAQARRSLRPGGSYVSTVPTLRRLAQAAVPRLGARRAAHRGAPQPRRPRAARALDGGGLAARGDRRPVPAGALPRRLRAPRVEARARQVGADRGLSYRKSAAYCSSLKPTSTVSPSTSTGRFTSLPSAASHFTSVASSAASTFALPSAR